MIGVVTSNADILNRIISRNKILGQKDSITIVQAGEQPIAICCVGETYLEAAIGVNRLVVLGVEKIVSIDIADISEEYQEGSVISPVFFKLGIEEKDDPCIVNKVEYVEGFDTLVTCEKNGKREDKKFYYDRTGYGIEAMAKEYNIPVLVIRLCTQDRKKFDLNNSFDRAIPVFEQFVMNFDESYNTHQQVINKIKKEQNNAD